MPDDFDIHVETVAEAINLLKTKQVTEISLDNDLGEGLDEGYKVADWLEAEAFHGTLRPLIIKVHSANSVRHKHMLVAISNAYRYWGV